MDDSSNVLDEYNKINQTYMKSTREKGQDDFETQQEKYRHFAPIYNDIIHKSNVENKYDEPKNFCEQMESVVADKTTAVILDYGCGGGLVAVDYLINRFGFKIIDGIEPCKEMLDVARSKGAMRNLYHMGSRDDHSVLPQKHYDVVFGHGVFFLSPSHPDFSNLRPLCKLVKKGGYIVIGTVQSYLKHFSREPITQLEAEGRIKMLPEFVFDGYRKSTPEEAEEYGEYVKGVVFKFQVL